MTTMFSVILLLLFNIVAARTYSITRTDSKLPTPRSDVTALYDGDDSIYVVGGSNNMAARNQLLKYNIGEDTIEIMAPNEIPNRYGSAALNMVEQSIYYSGGYNSTNNWDESGIWKIRLSDPETLVKVGDLPTGCSYSSSVWNHGEYIYRMGGRQLTINADLDTVVRISLNSNAAEVISKTPTPVSGTSAVWDPDNKVAYIFGGYRSGMVLNDILMFNETSGIVTKLSPILPYPIAYTCAVLIGREAFIVGGLGGSGSVMPFFKFDIDKHEATLLHVENFPFTPYRLGCAWVESLNSVYIFGGHYHTFYQDAIMYIEMNEDDNLTTTLPTTDISTTPTTDISISTTTPPFCPPSGIHDFPYPGNCTLYIKCIHGDPVVLSCTPYFSFDKIDKICKPADQAVCDEENPIKCPIDGSYNSFPHESNCSYFHYCYKEEQYTEECSNNAYYDEKLKGCTFAHEAVCHSECPGFGTLLIPIRATPCQWYKRCSGGISENYDCGNEQIYNPLKEDCVDLGEYTCPYV